MDQTLFTSRFTIRLILLFSAILTVIDSIEMKNSFKELHSYANSIESYIFNKCVKYHLITKIIFTIFSLLAAISAFCISVINSLACAYVSTSSEEDQHQFSFACIAAAVFHRAPN